MRQATIFHLTSMLSTKFGAFEEYLLELGRVASTRGFTTILQYESDPGSPAYRQALHDAGIAWLPIRTHDRPWRSVPRVLRALRRLRPDVVHVHFPDGAVILAVGLLGRALGARRLVAMLHNEMDLDRPHLHRRIAYNRFDQVLGVSGRVSESLRRAGVRPGKVRTHYLGLFGRRPADAGNRSEIRARIGLREDVPLLACIARDHPWKGLPTLLEALRRAPRERAPHLLLIGIDRGRSILATEVERLGLGGRVHWAGIVDAGWRLLPAADLYVQPSLNEGLGLAIVEAMALGLPVVGTTAGGIPEVVADGITGTLVPPGDAVRLAAAIDAVLADPSAARRMGEAGARRAAAVFSGERSVRDLVAVYDA